MLTGLSWVAAPSARDVSEKKGGDKLVADPGGTLRSVQSRTVVLSR